jgi:serine/threonine protein kinase
LRVTTRERLKKWSKVVCRRTQPNGVHTNQPTNHQSINQSHMLLILVLLVYLTICRPTAAKLMEHKFFKQVVRPEYVASSLLSSLPPLWERVRSTNQDGDLAQLKRRIVGSDADSDDEAWSFGKSLTQALNVDALHASSSAIPVPSSVASPPKPQGSTPPTSRFAAPSTSASAETMTV